MESVQVDQPIPEISRRLSLGAQLVSDNVSQYCFGRRKARAEVANGIVLQRLKTRQRRASCRHSGSHAAVDDTTMDRSEAPSKAW